MTNLNKIKSWVIQRLKEPSTYVGIGLLAITLGAPASLVNPLVQALGLIVGGGLVTHTERTQ